MHVDQGGLWYRVLAAKYGEVGGRIAEGGRGASAWWEGLVRSCEGVCLGVASWFDDNLRMVVGDGARSFFG